MEGETRLWRSAVALLAAGAAALVMISGAPGSGARAATPPAPPRVADLQHMVAQARAQERSLLEQVRAVRERLSRERGEIGRARSQLASLIATEYTGAPGGILEVIGSSSLNTALDTQIALSRLSSAEQGAIRQLRAEVRAQRRDQAQLELKQRQARVTAARLQAQEIAAAYLASRPPAPTPTSAAPQAATQSHPAPTPSSPATPPPTPPPTPTPPPPTPPSGAFTASTNLTLPSGIGLTQIQEFLQGTPLYADSAYFMQAQAARHVSAIYLVADAVLETGWGTSQLYVQKHNLFGFHAYDANPLQDGSTFPSDQACIAYVSWYVSVNYLTPPGSQVPNYPGQTGTVPTGLYYNGPTPKGMSVDYASDPLWAADIVRIGDALQQMPA